MELIDTPNPNAKKIELDNSVLSDNKFLDQQDKLSNDLEKLDGVSSVFFGPSFITITKGANVEWLSISQDIISIFDTIQ